MNTATEPKSKWDWTLTRSVRYRVRRAVGAHRAYLAFARLRTRPYMEINGVRVPHTSVVSHNTDIVIEGPGRCGNTFAVVAFQLAQDRPLRVAHHLHAEGQILEGVRRGLPVVLLIRKPEDVVVSSASSFGIPVREGLRIYTTFYERLLPHKGAVVTAEFSDVTGDFGGVVRRVNQKYRTAFRAFEHSEENVARCFEVIDEFYRRTAPEPGRTVARPSDGRQLRKEAARREYRLDTYRALRERADQLYGTFTPAR